LIGKPIEMVEDSHGLLTKSKVSDTTRGRDVMQLIRDKAIDQMSIGYNVIACDYSTENEKTTRILKELMLWEYSAVDFAMNEMASITGFKGIEDFYRVREMFGEVEKSLTDMRALIESYANELKAIVPYQNLPLAARDYAWDSAKAIARVRTFTKSDDAPTADYKSAFLYHDPENKDLFTSYKLPIADVVEGKMVAVPKAIFAVAAVLQGGRGGVDMPDADKARARSHVAKYYAKMRKEFEDDGVIAPWDKALEIDETLITEPVKSTQNKPLIDEKEAERILKAMQGLRTGF